MRSIRLSTSTLALAVYLGVLLLTSVLAHAQVGVSGAPTTPATPPVSNIIRRPAPSADGPAAPSTSSGAASTVRVILALGVVLALIVGLKMGAGKYLGIKPMGSSSNKGVAVLSRTLIGHRQQLVLIQVGRKLVLVSDSGGKVSPVTEITDPDEVAELAAQALGKGAGDGQFGGLIRKQASTYEATSEDFSDDAAEPRPDDVDLSELADRVRHINKKFSA